VAVAQILCATGCGSGGSQVRFAAATPLHLYATLLSLRTRQARCLHGIKRLFSSVLRRESTRGEPGAVHICRFRRFPGTCGMPTSFHRRCGDDNA